MIQTLAPVLPSTNDLIGQHMSHLERRLSEVLFKPEAPVFIECGDGVDPIQAVIKAIVGNIAFVQFCDEKTLDEVKLDQLIIGIAPYPCSTYSFDNLFSLRNLDNTQLLKSINSYIQIGHFFELIDRQHPRIVRTVKIIENQNGFVNVIDARGHYHSVLLSSDRCKRVGWSMLPRNDGQFYLEPYLGTTIKTIVPWFIFDRMQLREHSVEINQVLEVIDPYSRYRIIPGVVTEILSKYFFRVSLIYSQYEQNLPSIICHRGSPDLLPANFCSRSSLRLAAPDGIEDNNFNIYKIKGRHATENMFDIPKNVERFDTNRRIEIYDEQKELMIPATILRQHRHLLVVRMENQREFTSPRLYAYYDERVFNSGAAKRYGLKLAHVPELIDRTCWDCKINYNIVTKPILHDPTNGQRFMPKVFSDSSQFLPQLYVNFDCYKGPFINEETARFIDTQITSGHFQPVMRSIIHGVLENIIKFEYQKFAAALQQTQSPTYTIKLTNPKSDKRSRTLQVEVCENAAQFPQWLRQFLLRLEICPNFISPVKRLSDDSCPSGCHLISDLYPYMTPGMHIHNPSSVSRLEEQRAKRLYINNSSNTQTNIGITSSNTISSYPPSTKRSRNGLGISAANNSDHNDLDEPLSTRRARRNIVATKRHEIVMEEPQGWKKRTITNVQSLLANQDPPQFQGQHMGRRRRNTSNEFSNYEAGNTSMRFNGQNVPPRSSNSTKEYLIEMANHIGEALRGNLSCWDKTDQSAASNDSAANKLQQQHYDSIKAAAVRKANGPRMLFPQQMLNAASTSSTAFSLKPIRFGDLPPRLFPVKQRSTVPEPPRLIGTKIEIAKEQSDDNDDEDDLMLLDDEDSREAPHLSAMRPTVLSVKVNESELASVQQPQIQEYLRRVQKQKISPVDSLPDSTNSANKLPAVHLEKPGEYDTEIRQRPASSTKSTSSMDELLNKYGLGANANPMKWQNLELVDFMRRHHSLEVADFLEREEFDGQSFFMIEDEEIKDMGLKRGPELNLKRILKELKEISESYSGK